MSTRSCIIVHDPEPARPFEGFVAVYCHSDGYPDWNGRRLLEHFNDFQKARALVALGDLSDIGKDGDVCAYHRDRGEDWHDVKPRLCAFLHEVNEAFTNAGIEHAYLWHDGRWWHWAVAGGARAWTPLTEVVAALPER